MIGSQQQRWLGVADSRSPVVGWFVLSCLCDDRLQVFSCWPDGLYKLVVGPQIIAEI